MYYHGNMSMGAAETSVYREVVYIIIYYSKKF